MRSGYLLLAVGLACLFLRGDAAYLQDVEAKRYDCKPDSEMMALQPKEKERCLEYCKRSLFMLCRPLALSDRHRVATAPAAVRACPDARFNGRFPTESGPMLRRWNRETRTRKKKTRNAV